MKSLANLRILVIEDDPRMVELIRTGLSERGHFVQSASSAEQGQEIIDRSNFDAIVLDIGLPGRSGYTIAQQLRGRQSRPAVIMLTALGHEDQVVLGLEAGADDYLAKPFSFSELAARIVSAARRARIAAADFVHFGRFELDTARRTLRCGVEEVHITRNEYLLLHSLALRRGEIVSRRDLTQAVWGTTAISHGSLDTLLNTLRDKLNAIQPGLISTIRGRGYSLVEEADLHQHSAQEHLRVHDHSRIRSAS